MGRRSDPFGKKTLPPFCKENKNWKQPPFRANPQHSARHFLGTPRFSRVSRHFQVLSQWFLEEREAVEELSSSEMEPSPTFLLQGTSSLGIKGLGKTLTGCRNLELSNFLSSLSPLLPPLQNDFPKNFLRRNRRPDPQRTNPTGALPGIVYSFHHLFIFSVLKVLLFRWFSVLSEGNNEYNLC